MSGIGFSEFLILLMIGLIVLGPKRLPKVANQVGTWLGQARRMTRVMKRQLEEELDLDRELNIRPRIDLPAYTPPRDDDSYSPRHSPPAGAPAGAASTGTSSSGSPPDDGNGITAGKTDSDERREA